MTRFILGLVLLSMGGFCLVTFNPFSDNGPLMVGGGFALVLTGAIAIAFSSVWSEL